MPINTHKNVKCICKMCLCKNIQPLHASPKLL